MDGLTDREIDRSGVRDSGGGQRESETDRECVIVLNKKGHGHERDGNEEGWASS